MSDKDKNTENKESDLNNKELSDSKFGEFKTRKWLQYLLIIIAIGISVFLVYNGILFLKNSYSNFKEKIDENENDFNSNFFNTSFEFNSGTQSQSSVLDLLDDIISNNKKNTKHLITVAYNEYNTSDSNEITKIKGEITPNKKYEVSLDYDDKKYVNKVTISGTVDKDSFELKSFNGVYEMYSGTKKGVSLSVILDKVITNNKKSNDHLISIIFNNHNTTNVDEITSIKKELSEWNDYEVSLNYDNEGYVNQITIK